MTYIGNFDTNSTVRGGFNSRNSTGAPANFSSSGSLLVYKDATLPGTNSGITWANGVGANGGVTPFDNVTGYHLYSINTAANTSFYNQGDYRVILSSGEIGGVNVAGTQIGSFSLLNRTNSVSPSAINQIADGVLSRNVSNVETTAPEHSLATIVLANLENSIAGSTLTIKRTDGSTTHVTKTLTTSTSADKITGIQ